MEIKHHKRWIEAATLGLGETVRDSLLSLQKQVNSGIAQLWEIDTDQGKSWMISRVEKSEGQAPELVICCFKGCDLNTVSPVVVETAKQQGFGSIRYHTQRKGLNRLIVDLGFSPYETVYRKKLIQENHYVGR